MFLLKWPRTMGLALSSTMPLTCSIRRMTLTAWPFSSLFCFTSIGIITAGSCYTDHLNILKFRWNDCGTLLPVISSPALISFTTWMISVFWLTDLLNKGISPKQINKDKIMQKIPTTVRFFKKFIIRSLPFKLKQCDTVYVSCHLKP